MKIDIAVYTAQEGYSWQPGTAIGNDVLKVYKDRIGKFPSPDAVDFPFGGVFLEGDRVVFYRYHVAKKIDFRGRDALYCVLGVMSVSDASKVNVKTLFARPQFAGPMRPFPTAAEIDDAVESEVPEWLRNLDVMSLDVRITGTAEDMKCEVKQKQVVFPSPEPQENTKIGMSFEPNLKHPPTDSDLGELPKTAKLSGDEKQDSIPSKMSGVSSATHSNVLPLAALKNLLMKAWLRCKSPLAIVGGLLAVLIVSGLFVAFSRLSSCINSKRNESCSTSVETQKLDSISTSNLTHVLASGDMESSETLYRGIRFDCW